MSDKVSPEALAELIRNRRTVHDYTAEPPARELIFEALELGRWAPNHHRTEPWRFYLVEGTAVDKIVELNCRLVHEKQGEKVAAIKRKRWAAMPGWMVMTCRKSDDPILQREDYAACCCAVHNAALYLWSQGVGMKWTTGAVTRDPEFFTIIGADADSEFVVGLFWYGYPAAVPDQHRKELDDCLQIVSD